MKRLRIAYLVHDYSRSFGHGRYVVELATRFAKQHEVHVIANTFAEPAENGILYHKVPAARKNALTTVLSFIVPVERKLNTLGELILFIRREFVDSIKISQRPIFVRQLGTTNFASSKGG